MIIKRAYLQEEKDSIRQLLANKGLQFDDDIDASFYAEILGKTAATLSVAGNVIKAVAVDDDFAGQNLIASLVSYVLEYLHGRGIWNLLVFTKPQNTGVFQSLSFSLIAKTTHAAMMESSVCGISETLSLLAAQLPPCKNRSCIVANLNPITLGHKYLIEEAAKEAEQLVVFLVEENKSFFDFPTRMKLAKQELKNLKNVFVLPSTQYQISSATFPTYFLKKDSDVTSIYAEIDATIFCNYFVPIFKIDRRYVGTEPNCLVTAKYNAALQKEMGSMLQIIKRKKFGDKEISASIVRQLLKEKKWEELKHLVGEVTFGFLRINYE